MNTTMINETEVKKDLYKSKAVAKMSHYAEGELFYDVELSTGTYRFPISTIDESESHDSEGSVKLSSDLGTTPFYAEMKGSDLNRWIAMAIKSDKFVKISL